MRKRVMTGLVNEEHRVLTLCLPIVPKVQRLSICINVSGCLRTWKTIARRLFGSFMTPT